MKVTEEPKSSSRKMQLDQSGMAVLVFPGDDGSVGAGSSPGQSNGNGVRMSGTHIEKSRVGGEKGARGDKSLLIQSVCREPFPPDPQKEPSS